MAPKIEPPPRSPGEDWIINDIQVGFGNVNAIPSEADLERYRADRALAERRHEPQIFRTPRGGPGNHRRILGCACGASEAYAGRPPHTDGDARSWCAHVGILGTEGILTHLLELQDAINDAFGVGYLPNQPFCLDRLREIPDVVSPLSPEASIRRDAMLRARANPHAWEVLSRESRESREEMAARRHDPVVVRTTGDGPGNARRIQGCACGAPDVRDQTSWCAHVGVPGAEAIVDQLLTLQDAVADVVDYPEDPRCRERLRAQPLGLAALTTAAPIFARSGSDSGSDGARTEPA